MASELLWLPRTVATLLSTELNNLADTVLAIDATDYINATNKYMYADFLFFGTFDAACDAGAFVELHLFYKVDGTNYGDGEDGDVGAAVASGNSLHGVFIIDAVADAYQQILRVPLSPFDFRAGIVCNCGQALTAVDTHFLKIAPYNPEGQ